MSESPAAFAALADELAAMGRRLEVVSAQLRTAQPVPPAEPSPDPAPSGQAGPVQGGAPPAQPWPGYGRPWPGYQQAGPPPYGYPQAGQSHGQPWPGHAQPGQVHPGQWAHAGRAPVQAQQPGSVPPGQVPGSKPPLPPRPGLLDRDGGSGRLLAWVGGSVTLLGVVLLMALAVQRGWLGPVPRVLAGAVLGVAMIGVALRVHRMAGGRTGALALVATGSVALYLDVIAASLLYEFVPVPGALAIGLVVAGAGLVIADRWREQVLGVTIVVGAALFAAMLTNPESPGLVAFLLVLQAAAAPVQLRRRWPGLALAGAVPPAVAGVLCVSWAASNEPMWQAVLAVIAVAVGGAVLAVLGARLDEIQARSTSLVLLAIAPFPALLLAQLLTRWSAVMLTGGVAAGAAILWLARTETKRLRIVAGVVAAVAGFETTVFVFDGVTLTLVLLAEAAVLAGAAWRARSNGLLLATGAFLLVGGFRMVCFDVQPWLLVAAPTRGDVPSTGELIGAIAISVMFAAAVVLATLALRARHDGTEPVLVLSIAAVLYAEIGVVIAAALLITPTEAGFLGGHAVVTVSWTVAALVLLVRGIRSRPMRATGLGLVGAALAKLLLFDMASLDGVARVATFLGAGLVLLAAGTLYARLVAAADADEAKEEENPVSAG